GGTVSRQPSADTFCPSSVTETISDLTATACPAARALQRTVPSSPWKSPLSDRFMNIATAYPLPAVTVFGATSRTTLSCSGSVGVVVGVDVSIVYDQRPLSGAWSSWPAPPCPL